MDFTIGCVDCDCSGPSLALDLLWALVGLVLLWYDLVLWVLAGDMCLVLVAY